MSLYQCEKCGCIENTALGFYWVRGWSSWPEEFKDKALCSECGPTTFSDGGKTKWGKWHGEFTKTCCSIGTLEADGNGGMRPKRNDSSNKSN